MICFSFRGHSIIPESVKLTSPLLVKIESAVPLSSLESYFISISTLVSQKVETTRGVPPVFPLLQSPFLIPLWIAGLQQLIFGILLGFKAHLKMHLFGESDNSE